MSNFVTAYGCDMSAQQWPQGIKRPTSRSCLIHQLPGRVHLISVCSFPPCFRLTLILQPFQDQAQYVYTEIQQS